MFLAGADTDKPFSGLAWREEGPTQEGHAIVKSKHSVIIFDVVLCKKLVQFFGLYIVSKVEIGPRISCWKTVRLFVNLI